MYHLRSGCRQDWQKLAHGSNKANRGADQVIVDRNIDFFQHVSLFCTKFKLTKNGKKREQNYAGVFPGTP